MYDQAYHVVVADNGVYFGSSSDDKVYCLDIDTGKEKWSFFAEGPVRLAPSIYNGKIYFGSDDGYVYNRDRCKCYPRGRSGLWLFYGKFKCQSRCSGTIVQGFWIIYSYDLPDV